MTHTKHDIAQAQREQLTRAKRIVVKVGTNVLVNSRGRPNRQRIRHLIEQLAALQQAGYQVIFVSSGAIGAGMEVLNLSRRPKKIQDLQMAAAVGQTQLLQYYAQYFAKHRCKISQVLLTHADINHRTRHLNARNTLLNLLKHNVIPIINENDVVAVDEIRLGDNDVLSALTTSMIDADLLIILTTPDGLREPTDKRTKRVAYIPKITASVLGLARGKQDDRSSGGMLTKLQAAQTAANLGAQVVIASGKQANVIQRIMQGDNVGTLIGDTSHFVPMEKRKRWIRYYHRPKGNIMVNTCAVEMLRHRGKSLLPIGIVEVEGQFNKGAQVCIIDQKRQVLGFGLVEYTAAEINQIKGQHSKKIPVILGYNGSDEVIHRNNLVIEREP